MKNTPLTSNDDQLYVCIAKVKGNVLLEFLVPLLPCLVVTLVFFFFNDTATTEIYTLSLHDALPISTGPARLEPTAFTCVPGRTHSPSSTGVGDPVTVQMMSADTAASRASATALMRIPTSRCICSANRAARSADRPHTRTSSSRRTRMSARMWEVACSPQPNIASVLASCRASTSVATADAAAV